MVVCPEDLQEAETEADVADAVDVEMTLLCSCCCHCFDKAVGLRVAVEDDVAAFAEAAAVDVLQRQNEREVTKRLLLRCRSYAI
ncbi:hypothetical protein J5N97_016965 [Dioscorea zingiberensis]|uniref:Uncharacterized protein n=1 Tax=Dioscorea zingiberensis TaxID=325984 RepID=A0A9D5HFX2_9LILI|nr:hypothetical protein J5N97_016965 [Dioscorea zingiberensis]